VCLGVYKNIGLASKLYNFKWEPEPLSSINNSVEQFSDVADGNGNQEGDYGDMGDMYVCLGSQFLDWLQQLFMINWLSNSVCGTAVGLLGTDVMF
jgi:hypothetical protein